MTGVAAATAYLPLRALLDTQVRANPSSKDASETLVSTLHKTLSEEQRKAICFPFEHPLRSKVDNNWYITDKKIGTFFTADQQAMIREIFLKLHSPEYAGKVLQQVEHDAQASGVGSQSVSQRPDRIEKQVDVGCSCA